MKALLRVGLVFFRIWDYSAQKIPWLFTSNKLAGCGSIERVWGFRNAPTNLVLPDRAKETRYGFVETKSDKDKDLQDIEQWYWKVLLLNVAS